MTTKTTTQQQQHPAKAAIRTFVQVWVPGILTALIVIPEVAQAILDETALPEGFRVVLVGIVTGAAAVSAVLARIMAIPAVDAWLKHVGLSSTPKHAPLSADGVPDITTIDIAAPDGYEVPEVSDAKTEVVDILNQHDGEDRIAIGDRQVERLIEMGWRPTGTAR